MTDRTTLVPLPREGVTFGSSVWTTGDLTGVLMTKRIEVLIMCRRRFIELQDHDTRHSSGHRRKITLTKVTEIETVRLY